MSSIPLWISWLKYLSFVYYGELLQALQCLHPDKDPHCGDRKCDVSK